MVLNYVMLVSKVLPNYLLIQEMKHLQGLGSDECLQILDRRMLRSNLKRMESEAFLLRK